MILLLSAPAEAEPELPPGVVRRAPRDLDEVMGWVAAEDFRRIVVQWPTPGFNPFALARRLQAVEGPKVVVAGEMRPETRFWAERNGCELASDAADALSDQGGER